MGKGKLRADKTCLNCRYVVENRYCPNCGQENTDTRKTFHHLFIHFFEDLTHYENAFWKTIRNLLFKPSALTKEYLSGKRLSYLAPVRLYIFISFVTFFLITILPDSDWDSGPVTVRTENEMGETKDSVADSSSPAIVQIEKLMAAKVITKKDGDEMIAEMRKNIAKNNRSNFNFGFDTVEELDSLQKFGPEDEKLPEWIYNGQKKFLKVREENTEKELLEKFKESFMHNFPKVLFIYMPLFAFFLWLFHGKKRWYYFDHGIFTLHYFSFLLLVTLILKLIERFLYLFGQNIVTMPINGFFSFIGYIWMFYYFFPAHHRFYGETRFISLIKSLALLFINMVLISALMTAFVIYTFLTIH